MCATRKWIGSNVALLAVAVVLLGAGGVRAQSADREGAALEFRTDLPWARLSLRGPQNVSGVSPLRVPGPLEGDFWLVASGRGVERQRGRVRVDLDEGGSRLVSLGPNPVHSRLLQGLLFPGAPQLRAGDGSRGAVFAAAGAAGILGTVLAQIDLWDAADDVDAAARAVASSGSLAERERLQRELLLAGVDRTRAADRRMLFAWATAAIWGVSVFDALVFSPDFEIRSADRSALTLQMRRRTRLDAVLRSAVFPGLGQEYSGYRQKGAWMALGATLLGAYWVFQQDDYNESIREFEKAKALFDATDSIEERTTLLELQRALYAEVEDGERDRNIALGALGIYWGLSLLDTAIFFEEEWGDVRTGRLGLVVDPARGRVAAQVPF